MGTAITEGFPGDATENARTSLGSANSLSKRVKPRKNRPRGSYIRKIEELKGDATKRQKKENGKIGAGKDRK